MDTWIEFLLASCLNFTRSVTVHIIVPVRMEEKIALIVSSSGRSMVERKGCNNIVKCKHNKD